MKNLIYLAICFAVLYGNPALANKKYVTPYPPVPPKKPDYASPLIKPYPFKSLSGPAKPLPQLQNEAWKPKKGKKLSYDILPPAKSPKNIGTSGKNYEYRAFKNTSISMVSLEKLKDKEFMKAQAKSCTTYGGTWEGSKGKCTTINQDIRLVKKSSKGGVPLKDAGFGKVVTPKKVTKKAFVSNELDRELKKAEARLTSQAIGRSLSSPDYIENTPRRVRQGGSGSVH